MKFSIQNIKYRSVKIIAISIILILCSCVDRSKYKKIDKLKIVCTIGMISDLVTEIGGNHVEVTALMGPGVDPHQYKATPRDIKALYEADIIFYSGLYLEAKMGTLLGKMSNKRTIIALAESIPKDKLIPSVEHPDNYDPHVWFDVSLWIKVVQKAAEILAAAAPEKKDEFYSNAETYLAKLNELDNYVQKKANSIPAEQRVLITAHDAFGYFGKRYGFDVIGLQGISTEAEAGIADVRSLVEIIVSRKINAIFIESSVPVKNIQAVKEAVKARGHTVKIGGELFSDAMGDKDTFEGTYIGMITHNIDIISKALLNQ